MNLAPTRSELVDLFWRSTWTFISSALGVPLSAQMMSLDISILESMGMAGSIAVVGVVTVFARQKLGTISPTALAAPRA